LELVLNFGTKGCYDLFPLLISLLLPFFNYEIHY